MFTLQTITTDMTAADYSHTIGIERGCSVDCDADQAVAQHHLELSGYTGTIEYTCCGDSYCNATSSNDATDDNGAGDTGASDTGAGDTGAGDNNSGGPDGAASVTVSTTMMLAAISLALLKFMM